MEQLSGLDTAFVHQDSQRTPMHISAVLIYDAGDDGSRGLSLTGLKRLAAARLAQFPLFRRKLQRVPMGVDNPYWIDTGQIAWARHLSESKLPGKRDWQALHAALAELHGARIDLSRSVWEMRLLHGLNDVPGLPRRCQVLVLKVHHCAIDGVSLAAIINALHHPPAAGLQADSNSIAAPSQWELWSRANINSVGRGFKLAQTMGNLLPGFHRVIKNQRRFRDLPEIVSNGSHFNARVTAGRATGAVLFPKSEMLAIKRAVRRVTLNDIAICCVAGALQEYLRRWQNLPAANRSRSMLAARTLAARSLAARSLAAGRWPPAFQLICGTLRRWGREVTSWRL